MRWKRTAPPPVEPLTLQEVFTHLRIDGYGESPPHPETDLIAALILAAREWAEDYTGRVFAPGEFEMRLPGFRAHLPLPVAPVSSITSVEYLDLDGVTQTLSPAVYNAELDPDNPFLYLAYGATYPGTRCDPSAVVVTFQAGYDLPGDSPQVDPLPARARAAMLLVIGHLYENREDSATATTLVQIPHGAEYLLHPLRRDIL